MAQKMQGALLELILVPVLILLNGLFSLSEMAIVSSRRERLQLMAEKGKAGARAVLRILDNPDKFLSTIQVAITLISILTGVLSGAAIAEALAAVLPQIFPGAAAYAHSAAFFFVVFSVTYLSIVAGELVPKNIALTHPEAIASALALPLGFVIRILAPFSAVLSFSARLLLRPFGVSPVIKTPVTEEEIRMLVSEGHRSGALLASEKHMVEKVFDLNDIPVVNLMTPRPAIVWLDISDSPGVNLAKIRANSHSNFPVSDGALEKILGVLPARAILSDMASGQAKELRAYLLTPLYVPETMKASKLLEVFKQSQKHFAVIVDEFGNIQGIATLHNILEAIVGDLPPPETNTEQQIRRRDDGSYLLDGTLTLGDFREFFGFDLNDHTSGSVLYSTIAGFVTARLQHISAEGEKITLAIGTFEVLDMDGLRIDKVLFTPAETLRG